MTIAYLNGDYAPLADVRISPMDRGVLFGDGVLGGEAGHPGNVSCKSCPTGTGVAEAGPPGNVS